MKSSMWYHIVIQIDEPRQDLLIGQLAPLRFNGFKQEEEFLHCFISAQNWTRTIQAKFRTILERFRQEFPATEFHITITSLHEKNWNRLWEKQIGIIEVTKRIIIKPSWKTLPHRFRNKVVIHIDPKMSFGTGHHETTRMSLSLLERFIQPNMRVLDFGCGTGILGIACIKLGALFVTAIDNDPWAIKNTQENVKRNHAKFRMNILFGSVSTIPRLQFDLIAANIDYSTITKFIKTLASRVRKGGMIIFSGLLTSDLPALLPLFQAHSLVPVEHQNENEWTAIALCRI